MKTRTISIPLRTTPSDTEPAKILVFFIKDSDAPASMPVE